MDPWGSADGSGPTSATDPPGESGADTEDTDTSSADDPAGVACGCTPAEAFPNVWIANDVGGTVSKIDAETMEIRGRFVTRADGLGRPVSTAVSIDGSAVAVSNFAGGLLKIWARPDLCDANLNTLAGLQTSVNGAPMAWGTDECVDWYAPLGFTSQVALAWGPGDLDPMTCEYVDQVVWTAGCFTNSDASATVVRVNGDDGSPLGDTVLSGFPCDEGTPTLGAVDRDGGFWLANTTPGNERLARVSAQGNLTLFEVPPLVPAGIAIDAEGMVWLSANNGSGPTTAARFDPMSFVWTFADNLVARGNSGLVEDDYGHMWLSYATHPQGAVGTAWGGATYVDTETLHVGPPASLGCAAGHCTGISIDFAGRVWSTSAVDGRVYRYDPESSAVATIEDIQVSPYSSDLSGWALHNAACPGN